MVDILLLAKYVPSKLFFLTFYIILLKYLLLYIFFTRGDDHRLLKTEEELRSASLSLGELLKKKVSDGSVLELVHI